MAHKFIIDNRSGQLYTDFSGRRVTTAAEILKAERGLSPTLQVHVVNVATDTRAVTNETISNANVSLVIGEASAVPDKGLLKAQWNVSGTLYESANLDLQNLTADSLATAFNSAVYPVYIAGGLDIAEIGKGKFLLTMKNTGAVDGTPGLNVEAIDPPSGVEVTTVRTGDSNTRAQYLLSLAKLPVAKIASGSWSSATDGSYTGLSASISLNTTAMLAAISREQREFEISILNGNQVLHRSSVLINESLDPTASGTIVITSPTLFTLGSNAILQSETIALSGGLTYDGTTLAAPFLPLAGGTMTGALNLGDNINAQFGDSQQLKIYHNGANNGFIENSTAYLVLESSNIILRNTAGNEDYAKFLGDGAVELYYNNSKKFETTNLGATISGKLIVNGDLDVSGTTTTFNSTVVTVDDPVFGIGGDSAPGSDDNKDRGIEFRYYSGSAKVGFFGYDDSEDAFTFLTDATNNSEVFSGTLGNLKVGNILHGDGTAAAPSISFINDSDTGFYSIGGGSIGVSFNANQRWHWTADFFRAGATLGAEISSQAGSASLPNYRFRDDNNTGIFRADADTLAFSTGGTEAARFDSSGNLGIGYNNPSHPIHVRAEKDGDYVARITNTEATAGSNYGLKVDGGSNASDIGFEVANYAGDINLRVTGDGKVGIGGTPSQALHVNTSTNYQGLLINGNVAPNVCYAQNTATTPTWKAGISGTLGTAFSISQGSANTERLMILDGGNVGINDSSPSAKLSVIDDGSLTQDIVHIKGGGSSGDYDMLKIEANNGDDIFRVNASTYHVLLPDSDTKLGIGTTLPASKLQCTTVDAVNTFTMHRDGSNNGTNTALNRIQFAQDYDGTQSDFGRIDLTSNASSLRTDLKFYVKSTAGTEKLGLNIHGTVDQGARVGVGDVAIPSTLLHVSNGASGFSGSYNARTQAIIESDSASGTALAIMAKNTGSSAIWFGDQDGETVGQVGYNHTNNTLNFATEGATQAVLTSTGLAISGTDAPTEKLTVDGNIRINGDNRELYFSGNQAKFRTSSASSDVIFETGTTELLRLDGSASSINVPDNVPIKIGTNGDTRIYSTNSLSIYDFYNYDGLFRSLTNDKDIIFQTTTGDAQNEIMRLDGSTSLVKIQGEGSGEVFIGTANFGSGNYTGIGLAGELSAATYHLLSSTNDKNLYLNRTSGADMVFNENNTAQMRLKAGGNLGLGVVPSAKFDVLHSQTQSGSTAVATILSNSTTTATSTQSSAMYKIQNYLNLTGTGGSFQNSVHQQVKTTVSSTGTATNFKNHVSRVHSSGSGEILNTSHYNVHAELAGSGTIAKWIGYSVADGVMSSFENTGHTITNTYGLYIGDLTSGTQTNTPYGVYQANSDMINYFGGNVGIGCTPSVPLTVQGSTGANSFKTGDGTRFFRVYQDASNISLSADGSVNLDTYVGGAKRFKIDTDGDIEQNYINYTNGSNYEALKIEAGASSIKFNTTSVGSFSSNTRPIEFLINGNAKASVTDAGVYSQGHFYIAQTHSLRNATSHLNLTTSSQTDNDIIFKPNDTEAVRIKSNANVFIQSGDTVTGKLQIKGGKNTVSAIGEINSEIEFASNDASVGGEIGGKISSVTEHSNGAWVGLAFYTYHQSVSDLSEKMRLSKEGLLGIGTTQPSSKCTVDDGDFETTTAGKGIILKSPDGTRYRITVANDGTVTSTAV